MRIGEGEGLVLGHRDALAERRQRRERRLGQRQRLQQRVQGGAVELTMRQVGGPIEEEIEAVMLKRLHQAEMAAGQRQVLLRRQNSQNRQTERRKGLAQEALMAPGGAE